MASRAATDMPKHCCISQVQWERRELAYVVGVHVFIYDDVKMIQDRVPMMAVSE